MNFTLDCLVSGYITQTFKSNDPSDPSNYSGITVATAKLFNKIIDTRLYKFLEKHHIVNDSKIGFTRKARTSDYIDIYLF